MNRFTARLGTWMEEVVKYSRYVANGGLLFTLYFTLIYGAFVYNSFLERIDGTFPGTWIAAAVLLIMPLGHRPRTFVQEADQVFLLPELGDIRSYMIGVRLFNLVFAALRGLLFLLVLLPLLVRTESYSSIEVLSFVVTMVMLSAAGRLAKVEGVREWTILPFALGSGVLLLMNWTQWAWIPAFAPFILLHLKRNERIPLLHWLSLEEKSRAQFERVISWFVDLPTLKEEVRERRLLTRLLENRVLRRVDASRYVYGLRILRSNDSLDLILRLTVVALIVMWMSGGWYVGLVTPLFVGLTALQLVPLFKRLEAISIVSWLPITRDERIAGYSWWAMRLLVIQSVALVIASVAFGATWDAAVGLVLSILVTRYYLSRLK
ncbi:ABC transporter permease [Exiguobacterium profundum]|uniref:ABC transporter permease n=1 Tax=Exiguobacterium TaxID=33986 RepID=UPI0018DA711D|nr:MULTISPECIES: ABC transporter permease [Exiguobacterium]MCT4798535.1 ABC transporter permease [Exiguobacterium profundum]MDT0190848.1 ABC transporter permease [Exiguobacterium sp. BG5(2022)]QPI67046.1 ABC transporter permease [Exiguobacterium sp. PBE]